MPSERGFATLTIILVITLVLIVGGSLVYFTLVGVSNTPSTVPTSTPIEATNEATPAASTPSQVTNPELIQLKKEITTDVDKKIASLAGKITTNNQKTTHPKEEYVYFGINASSRSTDWETVPGSQIKFNTGSYPGAIGFYFQANLQSDAPDRIVHARLFDDTNSTPIWTSEINYTGLTPTFKESSALYINPGLIDINVQLRGLIGNLATIYNPRIKIVY